MTKDEFIRKTRLIQNFHSEQQTIQSLIDKISDGFPVVTIGDYLVAEVLRTISEQLNIPSDDDLLEWWLYEDVEKVIFEKDKRIDVSTLENLYDFIIDFYN